MKKIKTLIAALLCGFMVLGCASTDNNTEAMATGGTLQEDNVLNNTDSQAPMDADTDMSAEEETADYVSADNPVGQQPSIVALVQQNPNLSTLFDLIRAADMVQVLESPAPYTLFAPTNDAFAALPSGTLEALKRPENQLELSRILQAHVLPNRITAGELKHNMPLKTAQGQEVLVKVQGQDVTVGNATVLQTDVQAANGVVHVIDRVLLPPQN